MKKYTTDKLRNVAFVSHGGAGKTTLAESLLHISGAINRRGTIEEGTTASDHDPEEIKRQVSINAALLPCEWQNHKVNIVDTPGYFDFVGDVMASVRVVETAIIVVCAVSGVEVGTEKVSTICDRHNLPKIVYVNKMDRENANWNQVINQLQQLYGAKAIPVQVPIGSAETYCGYVDLIRMQAFVADENGVVKETDIPNELADVVEEARATLIETAASTDDELTMKFLEDEPLTNEDIINGLKAGIKSGSIVPILCGSALKEIGVGELLSFVIDCAPAPNDVAAVKATEVKSGNEIDVKPQESESVIAQVFKTMADPYVGKMNIFRVYSGVVKSDSVIYNVSQEKEERLGQLFVLRGKEHTPVVEVPAGDLAAVAKLQVTTTGDTLCAKDRQVKLVPLEFPKPKISMAVEPQAKGDEEKIGSGLSRLSEEDPTFTVGKSATTGELIISGLGDLHIEVMISRLAKKFGVTASLKDPKVPYKETIRAKVNSEYKHKKQSGGRGQYGHVVIEMEPLPTGGGFEFVDKIFGGSVPRQYIPAVEKGIRETLVEGVLAGYPVVDIQVTLLDGSYHDVDSSEMAFKIASSMAFKKGFAEAKPVLLEPIYTVTVEVPDSYMGDVIGDLNKKRGRIMGMDPIEGGMQRIRAQAPLAEIFRYAIDLRSMTQGRGDFEVEFDHYEEVPASIIDSVIAAIKKEQAS